MLDQDTARALLVLADRAGGRVAFVGDQHQLPAVGRGGVTTPSPSPVRGTAWSSDTVHRFTDAEYRDLTSMRLAVRPDEVFDRLHARGLVKVHPIDAERLDALTQADGTLVADTHD